MEVLHAPDPRLLRVAEEASIPPSTEVLRNALEMFDLMLVADGIGLAAPQVGWSARVFVMNIERSVFSEVAFINPKIEWVSAKRETAPEGCLSLPGLVVEVTRPVDILLSAYVLWGTQARKMSRRLSEIELRRITLPLKGLAARCAQHEAEHLDGILMTTSSGRVT